MLKDPEAIAKYQAATKSPPEANPLIGDAFKKQVLEETKELEGRGRSGKNRRSAVGERVGLPVPILRNGREGNGPPLIASGRGKSPAWKRD